MSQGTDNEDKGFPVILTRVIQNGREGYKGFKTHKELLDETVWDQASRLDPSFLPR